MASELRARLERAIARLEEKQASPEWIHRRYERDRLSAEIEGVQLALSYVSDEDRTAPQPVGYVVYYDRPSAVPSVLADVRQDGSGSIYTEQGATDRLAELHRYGYPECRIGAVYPVEED